MTYASHVIAIMTAWGGGGGRPFDTSTFPYQIVRRPHMWAGAQYAIFCWFNLLVDVNFYLCS
jgi:hypothetical protein